MDSGHSDGSRGGRADIRQGAEKHAASNPGENDAGLGHGEAAPAPAGHDRQQHGGEDRGQKPDSESPRADRDASMEDAPSEQAVKEKKTKKKKGKKGKDAGSDGLGSSRGIETMFRTSYRAHLDLTALADNKANIMISINGLMMSIILAYIAPKLDTNPWLLVPTTTLLLSCLLAIIYAILAARPRVHSGVVNVDDLIENRRNILFFGNYTRLSEEQFLRGVKNMLLDTDRLYTTMIRDLYAMGRVLEKKFKLLRTSYTAFMIGITISVVAFILVFVTEVGQ